MALSTHQSDKADSQLYNNKFLSLEPTYCHPLRGLKGIWKHSPSLVQGLKWLLSPPSISDHIPQIWKYFLSHLIIVKSVVKLGISNLHPLAYKLDGYLSSINLNKQQVQRFLLKILSPTSKFSTSAADLAGNQLHMCKPVFCEYLTQQLKLSASFSYKYSHCFERWVEPNYLLPFQVSADMFVWGCRVEQLKFTWLFTLRGPTSPPQKLRLGVSTALHRVMIICLI